MALLISAAQDTPGKASPHAGGRLIAPPGANEVTYCSGCHKSGCPVPHPELVKMPWQARGHAVVGSQGEVVCGSCHARGFRHRADAFVARDQKSLCNNCHFGSHSISNAHSSGQKCESCHTRPKDVLAHASPVLTREMKTSVDGECSRCHFDGPVSHRVGMQNTKKKAPDLPLSADGKITCVTCHIGHAEQDRFGVMLRKDNKRGGLCLSCHDDL